MYPNADGCCKVKMVLMEHKDLNCRGLEACTTGGNSTTATRKDGIHGNSGILSSVMLSVMLVRLGFCFLKRGQNDPHSQ